MRYFSKTTALLIMSAFIAFHQATAAETKSTVSPFKLSTVLDLSTEKDASNDVIGNNGLLDIAGKYKFTDDVGIGVTPRFKRYVRDNEDTRSVLSDIYFSVFKNNILTEKKDKMELNAGLTYRSFMDGKTKTDTDGYVTPSFSLTKFFTKEFSVNVYGEFRVYNQITDKKTDTTTKYKEELSLSPGYQFTDKFGSYFQVILFRIVKENAKTTNEVEVYPALTYEATARLHLEVYADMYPVLNNEWQDSYREATNYGITIAYKWL